jgi:hypothetical protein
MKKILFLLSMLASIAVLQAQQKPGQGNSKFKMPAVGHVYGKILDKGTNEGIFYATVLILKGDSILTGGFTKSNGEFNFESLPFGKLNVKVTYLGYKTYLQSITITPQTVEQDLGDIKLGPDQTLLKTVDIETEKSASEMSIDRKVFNVDKNVTSKGGTAMDVMKNIPSVTLDENGNAQLRQNAATIYIDGRPTTLTLDQIPADQIDRVEVITNPSAKFEASATGGIINIVMKSNTKPGYNGIVTGGIGTNNRYNGMVALNIKQSPIGISLVYNYNTLQNPVSGFTNRTNLLNGNSTGYFNSNDVNNFHNSFQTGSITLDYHLNNRNVLTLSGNAVQGIFNTSDYQIFGSSDPVMGIVSGNRQNNTQTEFTNLTGKLQYKKTFPKKGKELTADLNYNVNNGSSPSTYLTNNYQNGVLQADNPQYQQNLGKSQSEMYVLQADYVNPINDSTKIETGIRSSYKPSTQSLDVSELNYTTGLYAPDTFLTSHYKIKDMVNAAYVNYTTRYKGLNYMLGLRFEDSYYQGIITDKNASFSYQYPSKLDNLMNSLFPSLFIGKKLGAKNEVQFNISRKLNRPNYRQMMPYIMFSDKANYTIGNPNLTPEFITMAELNFNHQMEKGNWFITLFYRNTQNPLTPFSYPSLSDPGILVTTTVNGNQSNTLGLDNTLKYTILKNLEATFNANLFYTAIDVAYNSTSISNQGFYYTTKLNLIYHFPRSFNLQVSGNYESQKVIPQGTSNAIYFADCGLSKEIYKMMTFTLSVSDIFDTKARGSYLVTDTYIQSTSSRRESRYVKFTAMIRFGKADASIFKRKPQTQQSDDSGGDF